jgi:hypothetical protein
MKIGEIKVIDERLFSSGPGSSWIEYLVLERLVDGYKLDIRVYDCLCGQVFLDEDEYGEPIYPDEIDGKKIVKIEDEVYIDGKKIVNYVDDCLRGGDLVQATDDTPEITFKTFDEKILDDWLKKIRWFLRAFSNEKKTEEEVVKSLMNECIVGF